MPQAQRIKYSTVLKWLIVVAAYVYLVYRLIIFDDYATCIDYFRTIGTLPIIYIVLAFALFPLNILFESLKWRVLLRDIEPDMTIAEAQRQTYYGFVGAFITPSRLGDYPTRALLLTNKAHWLSAIALGFVGSLLLMLVILVIGLPAMMELFIGKQLMVQSNTLGEWHYAWAMVAFIFLLILAGCLPQMSRWIERRFHFRKQQTQQMIHALSQLKAAQLLTATGWTILRYLTFCLQLLLVLIACDVNLSLTTNPLPLLLAIPTYYLLVTLTPSLPIADVAIKGSWAIIIFSALGANVASITVVTILVWLINTISPMLIGTLVKRSA